ncbi:MAG: peptidoglycan DD-metalloendopeptidase family protein [Clostridia bacterium]|nr:peptidoglycan DD-metalloendopeptidase family protein [Clostridia bacterium]
MTRRNRIRIGKRWTAVLLAGIMALSIPGTISAGLTDATVQSYDDQIAAVEEKLKYAQGVLEDIQKYQSAAYEEIAQYDAVIELNNQLRQLAEEQLNGTQWQIRDKQQSIERTKEKMAQQQNILLERMRESYMEAEVDYIEVLLTSQSLFDFLKKLDYVDAMFRYDQQIITSLAKYQEELEADEAFLETAEQSQIEQLQKIDGIIAYNQTLCDEKLAYVEYLQANEVWWTEEYSYNSQREKELSDELEVYLQELEAERIRQEQERILAEQQAAADAAARQAALLQAQLSAAQQQEAALATSCWPLEAGVKVRISSTFGWRNIWGVNDLHRGIDLACPSGTKVYAYSSGKVEKSAYHYSYGNYVLIDHGGGLATLYAHMANRLVSAGDYVEAGQQIGAVGLTGSTSGYHLHFEVRLNGSLTDPKPYLVFP